jgi:O-antigen/teichoic acid export membrane protein
VIAAILRTVSEGPGVLKTPPAAGTAPGRGHLRYRRIALSAGAGIFQKLVAVGTGFISVPLVLRYLGKEEFGIWMAFMGFVTLMQFTDLGLGIGLQNRLTECDGTDDQIRPKRLISSTLAIMVFMASLLVLTALFVLPAAPLDRLVRTTSGAGELLPVTRAFLTAFAIVLPLGLVQYICNAYQQGYATSASFAVANAVSFTAMLIGIKAHLPLWWFIFVATVAPAPAYFALGAVLLRRKPWLRPAFGAVSLREIQRVLKLGLPAFGAQTGAALLLQGPTLVITSVLGVAAVGPFALTQQLLSAANLLLNVTLAPLWPAYGEAAARRDIVWIKRTFVRSVWASLVIVGGTSVIVAVLGRTVILLWTGRPEVVPTLPLLIACCTWAVVSAWNRACSMLLNGLGRMTGQAIYGVVLPVIAVALSFRYGRIIGTVGVVWIIVILGDVLRGAFLGGEVLFVAHGFNKLTAGGEDQQLR